MLTAPLASGVKAVLFSLTCFTGTAGMSLVRASVPSFACIFTSYVSSTHMHGYEESAYIARLCAPFAPTTLT